MWESDLVTFAKSKILLQTMSEIVHQDKLLYLGCSLDVLRGSLLKTKATTTPDLAFLGLAQVWI